jgi:predicted transcriptional regulator
VKTLKQAKLDCRITQELRDQIDAFAQGARLSRSQVVERALLAYFGETVLETPVATVQKRKAA